MQNNKYKNAKYTVEIEIERDIANVFNHVIQLPKWWPEDFKGEQIKLHSEFILSKGDSHYSKNKVVEFVPDKKVVWLAIECLRKKDNYDWSGTRFNIELIPKDGKTLLKFTYDGVVLENESDRLIQVCDITIKELFFNFITNGKAT